MTNQRTCAVLAAAVCVALTAKAFAAESLAVFQDLEEATLRIPQLKTKPFQKLIANGFLQSEVLVFRDLETGKEVWSLTREQCTDLANIERRCAWSCNGQYISFIGNTTFWNYLENKMWTRTWAGCNYVALADGSARRKLWGMSDGSPILLQDKFNNWDQKRPNVLYYPAGDKLWRVTLGEGEKDNRAEVIYTFPKKEPKIIQEISDDNLMLVEESGSNPNCYVVNLNREPTDPLFCMTAALKGQVHPGSFRFRRSRPLVTGGYENHANGGIRLLVDPAKGTFADAPAESDPFGVEMAHLWYGPPDDRAAFSGNVKGQGSGLFVQLPGKEPKKVADVSDGHPSWCGHDSEWFFYAVGEPDTDSPYNRRLVAGRADGSELVKVCTPFDRRRGGKRGYDAIPRPNESPDGSKCWFHSSMLNESDAYTGSYVAVFRRPYAPTNVAFAAGGKNIGITWTPHQLSYEIRGYHVYRSADGGKTWTEATTGALAGTSFTDAHAPATRPLSYAVTAEEWSGLESDLASRPITLNADGTSAAAADGLRGWDTQPPAKVEGFGAALEDGLVRLTWKASAEGDLRYYNVYASAQGQPAIEQKRRLVSPRRNETTYLDWSIPPGAHMTYAITAVDRQGHESEPVFAAPAK